MKNFKSLFVLVGIAAAVIGFFVLRDYYFKEQDRKQKERYETLRLEKERQEEAERQRLVRLYEFDEDSPCPYLDASVFEKLRRGYAQENQWYGDLSTVFPHGQAYLMFLPVDCFLYDERTQTFRTKDENHPNRFDIDASEVRWDAIENQRDYCFLLVSQKCRYIPYTMENKVYLKAIFAFRLDEEVTGERFTLPHTIDQILKR